MKKLEEFLKEWDFKEDTYFKVVNNIVYRNVQAGLIEEPRFKRSTRRAGKYRIVAEHFECALPYTNYYLIFDDKIYKTEQHTCWVSNVLNDMTSELKEIVKEGN